MTFDETSRASFLDATSFEYDPLAEEPTCFAEEDPREWLGNTIIAFLNGNCNGNACTTFSNIVHTAAEIIEVMNDDAARDAAKTSMEAPSIDIEAALEIDRYDLKQAKKGTLSKKPSVERRILNNICQIIYNMSASQLAQSRQPAEGPALRG